MPGMQRADRGDSPPVPLGRALGPFAGFDPQRCKQDQIHDLLAPLAAQRQSDRPMSFYGMRDVAAHFGVSLWTALAAYRRLEREGLIVRVRASRTLVPARSGATTQVDVRGVVALVNWLPGFLHTPDQRFVVTQLEKGLWDRGFVSEIVFYREEEKPDPNFAGRILAHRPNYVVWLMPGPADETTMATISDAGVRLVAIADQLVNTRTPQYKVGWEQGWRAAMRCWRREGVGNVVVPAPRWGLLGMRPWMEAILREMRIAHELFPFDEHETMERYVERLAAQPAGVLFVSDIWHARVCSQAPRAFARLLAARPVLQSWPLAIEAGILGDVRTDALLMPWQTVIDRIVGDLSSGQLGLMRDDATFEAVWRHRVPAASLARLYAYERI